MPCQRLDAIFQCGEETHRLSGVRNSEGGLQLTLNSPRELQIFTLGPEETEALCVVLNGLGEEVPWMTPPRVEKLESAIGFRVRPAEPDEEEDDG